MRSWMVLENRQEEPLPDDLPGDPDEQWNAITGGGPEEPVYVVGPSGFLMERNRETGKWWELATDTPDLLTGAGGSA